MTIGGRQATDTHTKGLTYGRMGDGWPSGRWMGREKESRPIRPQTARAGGAGDDGNEAVRRRVGGGSEAADAERPSRSVHVRGKVRSRVARVDPRAAARIDWRQRARATPHSAQRTSRWRRARKNNAPSTLEQVRAGATVIKTPEKGFDSELKSAARPDARGADSRPIWVVTRRKTRQQREQGPWKPLKLHSLRRHTHGVWARATMAKQGWRRDENRNTPPPQYGASGGTTFNSCRE
jgi:hypothetical protein